MPLDQSHAGLINVIVPILLILVPYVVAVTSALLGIVVITLLKPRPEPKLKAANAYCGFCGNPSENQVSAIAMENGSLAVYECETCGKQTCLPTQCQ